MPLKLYPPRKEKTPYWSVRGTYLGVYIDRSTKARKRAVAAQVLKRIERDIERGELAQRGEPTFASAAAAYMKAGGERTYVKKLLEYFGETPLSRIDQAAIDAAAHALYANGTPGTRNRSCYTPISAILRRAGTRLDLRRPVGSAGTKKTSWLWPEAAHRLFEEALLIDKAFGALIITLCYTGLRLNEALGLTWNRTRLSDGYAYVPTTKNAEPRAVYLPPVAVAALANLEQSPGHVFGFSKSGHLYSLLRVAAIRADVELPERSAFHIFRHTYATWMRRYAGADTQALIATGTWKDRKSVDRYTHTVVSEEAQRAAMLPTPGKKSA